MRTIRSMSMCNLLLLGRRLDGWMQAKRCFCELYQCGEGIAKHLRVNGNANTKEKEKIIRRHQYLAVESRLASSVKINGTHLHNSPCRSVSNSRSRYVGINKLAFSLGRHTRHSTALNGFKISQKVLTPQHHNSTQF